jgi:hypothetical protein
VPPCSALARPSSAIPTEEEERAEVPVEEPPRAEAPRLEEAVRVDRSVEEPAAAAKSWTRD